MAKSKGSDQEKEQELSQPYDTTFKDWIRQKELKMYDRLWAKDPDVQQTRAEAKTEGKSEQLA